jgi:hypothetical protein
MRVGWIGCHVEGLQALRTLVESGVAVEAVITLRDEAAARRSGSGTTRYGALCKQFGLRLHEVESINDAQAIDLLRTLNLDLVFVIGWTELLRPPVLSLARIGMIGAHASLLPRDRGRAPINWALIRGERRCDRSGDDSDHAVRHLRVALRSRGGRQPRHDPAGRAGAVGGTASWPSAGAAFRSAAAEAAAGGRVYRLDAIERRGLRLRPRADAALSRRVQRSRKRTRRHLALRTPSRWRRRARARG